MSFGSIERTDAAGSWCGGDLLGGRKLCSQCTNGILIGK